MKAVNIMNFVRDIDERMENSKEILYQTTLAQLEMVNEFEFENTFLLQYDVLCDERYVQLFKEKATNKTELGLWYEIVEPLTTACGMPYESKYGWKWDWHIVPGYSMAYTPADREKLADEAMRKFKEVFGYYPRTFAGWVIDTHTMQYLAQNYDLDAVAICRDQTNTDAYTLVGGYFNGAYYPSRNNIFTPAQTKEYQINVPVFRLLGPSPINNYDEHKYLSEKAIEFFGDHGCFTLEPVWKTGADPDCVDWFFSTFYENEDLGFSYSQLGQENSFAEDGFLPALRMQFEKLSKRRDVTVIKMGDTGRYFKNTYPDSTPATAVTALENWDKDRDIQSVYYDCKNYMANLFRYENSIFLRALYLFDERVADLYLEKQCASFDAVYENLPLVDTLFWTPNELKNCGLQLSAEGTAVTVEKYKEHGLQISWNDGRVLFEEDCITVSANELRLFTGKPNCTIKVVGNTIEYLYKNTAYYLDIENAAVKQDEECILITPYSEEVRLIPRRG